MRKIPACEPGTEDGGLNCIHWGAINVLYCSVIQFFWSIVILLILSVSCGNKIYIIAWCSSADEQFLGFMLYLLLMSQVWDQFFRNFCHMYFHWTYIPIWNFCVPGQVTARMVPTMEGKNNLSHWSFTWYNQARLWLGSYISVGEIKESRGSLCKHSCSSWGDPSQDRDVCLLSVEKYLMFFFPRILSLLPEIQVFRQQKYMLCTQHGQTIALLLQSSSLVNAKKNSLQGVEKSSQHRQVSNY